MSAARSGVVESFDAALGLGLVRRNDGEGVPFHCIEIADGSRTIEVGTQVSFHLLGKLGRYEATGVTPR
jgi:cold shock CspA family protein